MSTGVFCLCLWSLPFILGIVYGIQTWVYSSDSFSRWWVFAVVVKATYFRSVAGVKSWVQIAVLANKCDQYYCFVFGIVHRKELYVMQNVNKSIVLSSFCPPLLICFISLSTCTCTRPEALKYKNNLVSNLSFKKALFF